jgi:hypothetical protein
MFSRIRCIDVFAALLLASVAAACGDDDGNDGNDDRPDAMQGTPPDASTPPVDAAPMLTCFDEEAFFQKAELSNTFGADPQLTAPHAATPSFAPMAGSPVLTNGATPPDDGFFVTTATFIGAIGDADWTTGWTAYPVNTSDPDDAAGEVITVDANVTADATWTTNNTYVLQGKIFVTGGATLTIEPGVIVRGGTGDSALVIAKDGTIDAQGTVDDPITFTSLKTTGAVAGDWGGVVLLGAAPINVPGGTDSAEGFESSAALAAYGGTDAAHDCGTMKYVRIQYAGFLFSMDNELNGLTVAGCGSDTELDFVQIHRGLDDGIEFFGGTANVRHLLVSYPDDDGLDCDLGWVGKAQFVIVKQDANTGDKGIECDNNNSDNDLTPRTSPQIWNISLIGSDADGAKKQAGMHLRRGVAGEINNAIVAYFRSFALDVDGSASVARADAGDLTVANSYFFDNGGGEDWPADFDLNSMTGAQNDCSAE